jgi:hypothetical protein
MTDRPVADREPLSTEASAVFSSCRTWRYELRRRWEDGPLVAFIGLNPSTADETQDDPTIRRCIGFAKRWGYGGLIMANLFAFRATDPRDMRAAASAAVGPLNDAHLEAVYWASAMIVAAWGVGGSFRNRDGEVSRLLGTMMALGFTKGGHPRHPLYVRADAPLVEFSPTSYPAAGRMLP